VSDAVRAYAGAKRFAAVTVERWQRWEEADQNALLTIVERLRLGENHVRDLLDALEAIVARRSCTFADVLAEQSVTAVLAAGHARNETVHALKLALRRLRFPQLTATEERLRATVKQMGLPTGATITLPEGLEGEEVLLSVRATSAAELRRRVAAVAAAVDGAAVDEIYRVLGGEW
jgi:hypothetical protein